MTVDSVQDDRLATDGAREVCSPITRWWLDWLDDYRRELAEVKALYAAMEPLVTSIEPKEDDNETI